MEDTFKCKETIAVKKKKVPKNKIQRNNCSRSNSFLTNLAIIQIIPSTYNII